MNVIPLRRGPEPRASDVRRARQRSMASAAVVWLLLLLGSSAPAQTVLDEGPQGLVDAVTHALRKSDFEAMEAIFDAEAALADLDAIGQAPRPWESLDVRGRRRFVLESTKAWVRNEAQFHRDAVVMSAEKIDDPNATLGAITGRTLVRLRVRNLRSDDQRDVILVGSPSNTLLQLQFGEVIPRAAAATTPPLEPEAWSVREPRSPVWFDDVTLSERDELRVIVLEYEVATSADDLAGLGDELHYDAHVSVATLLERLIELDRLGEAPSPATIKLFAMIERITGRPTPGKVGGGAHDELVAWLRWQQRYGLEFEPGDFIESPVSADGDGPVEYEGWAVALARRAAEAEALAVAKEKEQDEREATAEPDEPVEPETPTPKPWQPPKKKIAGLDTPAPPPTVYATPVALSDEAKEIRVRRAKKVKDAEDIASDLSRGQIEILNDWAPLIIEHELLVVIGEAPAVVLGAASKKVADRFSEVIDETHALMNELVPTGEARTPDPVVALAIDYESFREKVVHLDFIERLVGAGTLDGRALDAMNEDPTSLMVRALPGFLQFTWDMAGDSSAGDDEFRVENEVANKYTQCLITTRLGPTPDTLRWGMGFVAEMALFNSVYMFNTTGFVSSGDHFDWHVRTRQFLEKRRSKWSFGDDMLREDLAGTAQDSQMITWGGLDYLRVKAPERLSALWSELSSAQRRASKWSTVFKVPVEDVDALIDAAFEGVETKSVLSYLRAAQ